MKKKAHPQVPYGHALDDDLDPSQAVLGFWCQNRDTFVPSPDRVSIPVEHDLVLLGLLSYGLLYVAWLT